MKIKTISRSSDLFVPVKNTQKSVQVRNLDPALHPFERAREYTTALTATKLERLFAKPFLGQLGNGHNDGISCIEKDFFSTSKVSSGSDDGVIKIWNLTTMNEFKSFNAHDSKVNGISFVDKGKRLLSCSLDKTIKLWDAIKETDNDDQTIIDSTNETSIKTFYGEYGFSNLDSHFEEPLFVTSGHKVFLWNLTRSNFLSDLSWDVASTHSIKFNKSEMSIFASAGSDNSIVLYDIRMNTSIQKIITTSRSNAISWNPIESYIFATGCEDHNSYLWDMRKLDISLNIYKDHVNSIMDLDFSPTGKELVTGSYDRSIRIYNTNEGHSKEIYHTKRMQRVFCVKYTSDSRYILSGSDDFNVRLWRANASQRSSIKSTKQRLNNEYLEKLKQKYKHLPEIKRISRHRHIPANIKKSSTIKKIEISSLKRKEENKRRHSKKEDVTFVPERKKNIRKIEVQSPN